MNFKDSYKTPNFHRIHQRGGDNQVLWFSGVIPQHSLKNSFPGHLETPWGRKVQARQAAGILKDYEVSLTGLNDFTKQQNNRNPWHLSNQRSQTKSFPLTYVGPVIDPCDTSEPVQCRKPQRAARGCAGLRDTRRIPRWVELDSSILQLPTWVQQFLIFPTHNILSSFGSQGKLLFPTKQHLQVGRKNEPWPSRKQGLKGDPR